MHTHQPWAKNSTLGPADSIIWQMLESQRVPEATAGITDLIICTLWIDKIFLGLKQDSPPVSSGFMTRTHARKHPVSEPYSWVHIISNGVV